MGGVCANEVVLFLFKGGERGFAIGCMYAVPPTAGEKFFLQLLLTQVCGPTSFEDLQTVDGVLHNSFKAACFHCGLLGDDSEWKQCLNEAKMMQTGLSFSHLTMIIRGWYQLIRFSVKVIICDSPDTLLTIFSCGTLEWVLRIHLWWSWLQTKKGIPFSPTFNARGGVWLWTLPYWSDVNCS